MKQLNNVVEDIAEERTGGELSSWEETLTQMYLALHEYRFERIDFLELLERWKEILHLPPSTKL